MSFKARLDGHPFDLDTLAQMLPDGDTWVGRDGEGFFLSAAEIDHRPNDMAFYEITADVLERVNGLARATHPKFRPVRLTGSYTNGERRHQVVHAGTAECRVQVGTPTVVIDGLPAPRPTPPGLHRVRRAAADPDIAEALRILGQPDPPAWVELYKVFEIVEDSGRLSAARNAAGISKNELERFTRTACHPQAAGAAARHARSNKQPPPQPMTLPDAQATIGRLVQAWIDLTPDPAAVPSI